MYQKEKEVHEVLYMTPFFLAKTIDFFHTDVLLTVHLVYT
jgi:hypothetical protein